MLMAAMLRALFCVFTLIVLGLVLCFANALRVCRRMLCRLRALCRTLTIISVFERD